MTHHWPLKEKRLHEGGVRPEMRSLAGLTIQILHGAEQKAEAVQSRDNPRHINTKGAQ